MTQDDLPIAPATPPKRNLSQGMKSLVVLGVLGSASAIAGLVMAGRPDAAMVQTAEAATPLPLAARLVSAVDVVGAPKQLVKAEGKLERNETLTGLVNRLGAPVGEANAALQAVYSKDLIDHRRLRPGLEAETFVEDGRLTALAIKADADRSLLVTRTLEGGWQATQLNAKLKPSYKRVAAEIDGSIYNAALKLGAGDQQVVDFASAFAYDIDFQREIHPGDRFEIFFETFVDERGNPVRNGEVLYAALDGKALKRGFYRFTPSDDGVSDYFDEKGESATKFLMKTPINGARISSNFGTRRHPISGYTRLHKGTDFAAPTGTPVYAAGSGTVQRASWNGGYGNYIKIKHTRGYDTAYAHLSRYAKGVKSGRKVRQGEVIGYVGSTGASTGPHLHYEVYVDGKPLNAMSLKLPTGRKLAEDPAMLAEFRQHKDAIDTLRTSGTAGPMAAVVPREATPVSP
ncbi:peptidase, M23 family [Hyphomonas neptunium ATCC 15444]|uniref:Peptidase, M23 family n=2 Tax=Hyphomonas TaxID=85 RepID=Q0C4I1_HYPNA|nr:MULTISPECIES: M23 family metallopeptidase [Hyphomonas]ABI78069.1 peptidase, M23 family [Hyphomonas neptunium ATCC 15444]KCZ96426.1 M23 family peptidase [Hyphomonas hirschiana VP5]